MAPASPHVLEGRFRLQPKQQRRSARPSDHQPQGVFMTRCMSSRIRWASVIALLAAGASSAQTGGTGTTTPPTGQQTEKPQSPETAPKQTPFGTIGAPIPGGANLGPTREIKLAPDTWFRFAVQVQAWAQAHQDRLTTGADGSYGYDFYCRRCRFFATGSVVKNVFFNFLFEAGNFGKVDPVTGVKAANTPQVLDAYGQVKFADAFWLSAGNILMPLSRNGTQPTTTYLSLDTANITSSPVLQGNTFVLRDLGIQANGFFADNHLEYRLGVFQGSRQPSTGTAAQVAGGTGATGGHNAPRFVGSLMYDFWDPEVGYVNGGHYYGTKKVLGLMVNGDYQVFRTDGPGLPAPGGTVNQPGGTSKNPYYGFSAAAFINYPLSGQANRTGGDELAALLQYGMYDGGFAVNAAGTAAANPGTYPNVLKQTNFLAEAAYYNHSAKVSVFGKYEMRKISDDYGGPIGAALKASTTIGNVTWAAAGLKYYIAPANLMNLTLQYERVINNDVPAGQQSGVNNITLAYQVILY